MKIQWSALETQITIAKIVAAVMFLIYFIHAPDAFFHHLLVIAHTIYESIAFVIEEFLHHVFHLNKFQSQLIVFYSSWGVALYGLYRLWRRWPDISRAFKNHIYKHYFWLKTQTLQIWKSSGLLQKIKLLLIHFGITFGGIVFLLT